MRSWDLEVAVFVAGSAILPIHDSVVLRVDSCLLNGIRNVAAQVVQELTGAASGVARRQNIRSVLIQDMFAHRFRRPKYRWMHNVPTERRTKRDHRRDILRPLRCNRSCNHAAKTVSDEVNLLPSICERLLDGLRQTVLDKKVGTLGVQSDAGKVSAVSDAIQPGIEVR